jgi:hypothetical protein
MAQLQIALQEGFANDEVVVHAGGEEVYHKENVTTRMQISLADSFAVELPERPSNAPVHITVSVRGVETGADVHPEQTPFLAVSVRDDKVSIESSATPYGYL